LAVKRWRQDGKYPKVKTLQERHQTLTKYMYLYNKTLKQAIPAPRVPIRIPPLPIMYYRMGITGIPNGSRQIKPAVMSTSQSETQPNQQTSSQMTYHPTLRGRKEDDVPLTTRTTYLEEPLLRWRREEDIAYALTTQQTYPDEPAW
jgi:hypothetical protein